MKESKFSRRSLLERIGCAGALAPFVPLLADDVEAATVRRRLILMWTPDAPHSRRWDPIGTATNFTLNTSMAPLEPFKSKLNILEVDRSPGIWGGTFLGSGHGENTIQSFTGVAAPPGPFDDFGLGGAKVLGWPKVESVDQIVADAIAPQVGTPFKSLPFAVMAENSHPMKRVFYRSGSPVEPWQDPNQAFKDLFAGRMGMPDPQLQRLQQERRSVLDVVMRQLTSARARLGRADQTRIDSHFDAVRAIETRLADPALTVCQATKPSGQFPDQTAPNNSGSPRSDVSYYDSYPPILDLHIDMLVAALKCDLSRVATLQLSGSGVIVLFTWLGQSQNAHQDGHDAGYPDDASPAQDRLAARATWFAQKFASLLDKLNQVNEGGGTMLDNSLVAWNWELGAFPGNHNSLDSRWVLAGSCGGYFKTGRCFNNRYAAHQPHTPILVSMCHAMGVTSIQHLGPSRMAIDNNGGTVPVPDGPFSWLTG